MSEAFFGERVAAHYDERLGDMASPARVDPVVQALAELARGGAALEFGIGTGRIAPLTHLSHSHVSVYVKP